MNAQTKRIDYFSIPMIPATKLATCLPSTSQATEYDSPQHVSG